MIAEQPRSKHIKSIQKGNIRDKKRRGLQASSTCQRTCVKIENRELDLVMMCSKKCT